MQYNLNRIDDSSSLINSRNLKEVKEKFGTEGHFLIFRKSLFYPLINKLASYYENYNHFDDKSSNSLGGTHSYEGEETDFHQIERLFERRKNPVYRCGVGILNRKLSRMRKSKPNPLRLNLAPMAYNYSKCSKSNYAVGMFSNNLIFFNRIKTPIGNFISGFFISIANLESILRRDKIIEKFLTQHSISFHFNLKEVFSIGSQEILFKKSLSMKASSLPELTIKVELLR